MKQKAANNILNIINREKTTIYRPSVKMIFKLVKDQVKEITENKRDVVSYKLIEGIITQTRHMEIQRLMTEDRGNCEPYKKIKKDISALVALFDNIYSEGLYERTLANPRQSAIVPTNTDDDHLDTVSQEFHPNI
ncbi:MAG: hypothetical protein GY797_22195 [Deltaproteobacteria bacterium]|nr:hypothetical protein [Deltaproteobacteria bacterium]